MSEQDRQWNLNEWSGEGNPQWGGDALAVEGIVCLSDIDIAYIVRGFLLVVRDVDIVTIFDGVIISTGAKVLPAALDSLAELDSLTLTDVVFLLTVNELGSIGVLDKPQFTWHYNLIADEAYSDAIIDTFVLIRTYVLAVAELTGNTILLDAIVLVQHYLLQVYELSCIAPLEALILKVNFYLVSNDLTSLGIIDILSLVHRNKLAVGDAYSNTVIEKVQFPSFGQLADTRLENVTMVWTLEPV